jgi:YegS/Rv2252/BmrU family lipid kinase
MSEHASPRPIRRVRIIANPISGAIARRAVVPRCVEVLSRAGIEVETAPTEGPGHATALAGEACRRGLCAVVAVGGDGTVNEVVNGMLPGRTALATVPTGTANMLARELGVPFLADAAARVIAAGRRRRLDVGVVNGRRFAMVVGVGFDAAVVAAVSSARRGHLGQHRYLAHVAKTMMEYSFTPIDVRIDDEPTLRRASLLFACNTRNYAAHFALAPDARSDDGRLDFVLVTGGAARDFPRWLYGAFTGTLPRYRDVTYVQGRKLEVSAAGPVPVQIDGDPGGTTPLLVSLLPGALEVLVP